MAVDDDQMDEILEKKKTLMQNRATAFQLETQDVRGRLIRVDSLLNEIIQKHDYPSLINKQLCHAIVLGIMLANTFKFQGLFTLQISGDGPFRLLVIDIVKGDDAQPSTVRACARYDEEAIEILSKQADISSISIPALFGPGYLAFTIDPEATSSQHQNRYQGIVELTGKTLSDCVQHFFRQSEQLETGLVVFCQENDDHTWQAASLMIQRMPGDPTDSSEEIEEKNDQWLQALSILGTTRSDEMLCRDLSDEDILYRLYWERGVRTYTSVPFVAKCRCSQEKIEDMLKTFSHEDLEEMRKNDKMNDQIEVSCEFCSTNYHVNPENLNKEEQK